MNNVRQLASYIIQSSAVTVEASGSQLTLSLYPMTQCQLKLRHLVTSLAQTLDYIKVAHRAEAVRRTLHPTRTEDDSTQSADMRNNNDELNYVRGEHIPARRRFYAVVTLILTR